LKEVEEGAGKPPPPVLVLNGHYGGCVGDLPSYDAFTLGGPYSVRGYNMGELGAARNILEVSFTGDNILPRIKMNCVLSGSYLMFLLKMEPLQELIVCRW
jgi:hypothetical protein